MRIQTSNLNLMLAAFLFAVPAVSNSQIVSACHSVANTSRSEFTLSSAFDGTNFLVGIRGNASSPDRVGAQLLSPTGNRARPLTSTGRTTEGQTAAPYVAYGAPNYLMAWTDAGSQHASSDSDIYAQFVSPAGLLVGNAFPVTSALGDQDAGGVSFDGTNFLVVWWGTEGLRGRRVSPDGQLLDSELAVTSAPQIRGQLSVAFGGGQHFVVWVEGPSGAYVTKGRMISSAGQMGGILTLSQATSDSYNPTSVAFGAGRFLVVWHHSAFSGADWNLRGGLVLPDGTMVSDDLILTAGPHDELAMANCVVFDGQHFLLVWADWVGDFGAGQGTVLGRYWGSDGVPQGAAFTIEGTPAYQLPVGLSLGSGKVLTVVNKDLLTPAADLCARFITRPFVQLTPLGPPSIGVTFGGTLQFSTNLGTWLDYSPQPTSPWTNQIGEGSLFFRSRAETTP